MTLLENVTYEQFKEFLDSLDEEREMWSLDLQNFKNDKEFYDGQKNYTLICVCDEGMIGLCCGYNNVETKTIDLPLLVIYTHTIYIYIYIYYKINSKIIE